MYLEVTHKARFHKNAEAQSRCSRSGVKNITVWRRVDQRWIPQTALMQALSLLLHV